MKAYWLHYRPSIFLLRYFNIDQIYFLAMMLHVEIKYFSIFAKEHCYLYVIDTILLNCIGLRLLKVHILYCILILTMCFLQ